MTSVNTMPAWLEPMAATLTQDRFTGGDWLFERKFDGIRLLAYKRAATLVVFAQTTFCRLAGRAGCRRTCARTTSRRQ